jgi:hypothetical protein
MHRVTVEPPGRGLSLDRHGRASGRVERFCCGSRPWITPWPFGTTRTKKSMALGRISPSMVNVAARCNRQPLARHLRPVASLRRHPRVAC